MYLAGVKYIPTSINIGQKTKLHKSNIGMQALSILLVLVRFIRTRSKIRMATTYKNMPKASFAKETEFPDNTNVNKELIAKKTVGIIMYTSLVILT